MPEAMTDIQVSALNVYPVKSAAGIAVESARVVRRGFEHDRRWMVVDEGGRFLSQRTLHRMALLRVRLGPDRLTLSAPEVAPLEVPLDMPSGPRRQVQIWSDTCDAVEVEPARTWLGAVLGQP